MDSFNKLALGDVTRISFFMPFPQFPSFQIHLQHSHPKFHHIIDNAIEGKVMFHLGDPS